MERALSTAAGFATGLPLAALSALRRGKVVHPHGVVHAATLVVGERAGLDAELFQTPGERQAVVRFSRALGLPQPLPDLLGMSIRIPHAYGPGHHQDLLLVTSADLPVVHHGFLPARGVQSRPYTSALPYRVGERLWVFGALPDPASTRPGQLGFKLAVAAPFGRFRPVAELRIGERLPAVLDALRFAPANTGGGLEPAGFLNRMREIAYPLSQAAWRRARRDGEQVQDGAVQMLDRVASGRG